MKFTQRELQKRLTHLQVAKEYAKLSYATRSKVGAVLVKDDRIISVGYNGTCSGRPNECEILVERANTFLTNRVSVLTGIPIYKTETYDELETKSEVVHAEMNVIAFAAKHGVSTNCCIMYITHSPCYECSKLIVQSGINEVYYETEYRIKEGIEFLKECGIKVMDFGGFDGQTQASGGGEEDV